MDFLKEKISGIEISTNNKSKRIINIKIKEESLDKLVFPFNKFNILALEYKPFTRFTIAKSFERVRWVNQWEFFLDMDQFLFFFQCVVHEIIFLTDDSTIL